MDINCDLGEGLGNDAQIMPFISSCNIACGAHAGNLSIMRSTVLLAKKHDVKIGAHPSFSDRENFGRKEMFIPKAILKSKIINQISTLKEIAENEGVTLHHIKPHGALYNMAAKFNDVAMAVIEAVEYFDEDLILYVPYRSLIARRLRERNMLFFYETFADRAYNDDLTLVSRDECDSLIEDTNRISKRVKQLIDLGTINTINGKIVNIKSDTICVHGDNPNVVKIVRVLSKKLNN
ncbi:MAG: 5-oxoprolinase subunit PxpA [Flavobacteriaceae bacterium]|nr:5-oxoprolinase subunit PxpA [Flavobacteriaceae bacterium]